MLQTSCLNTLRTIIRTLALLDMRLFVIWLYISAIELGKVGDAIVHSYHVLMSFFLDTKSNLAEVSVKRDGMSLDEKESNAEATGSSMTIVDMYPDFADHVVDKRLHEHVKPQDRKRKLGCPTNAREKPRYEVGVQRSRYSTRCHAKGHIITTCPMHSHLTRKPRRETTCSNCSLTCHWKTNCQF
jgi:hypothetical protein